MQFLVLNTRLPFLRPTDRKTEVTGDLLSSTSSPAYSPSHFISCIFHSNLFSFWFSHTRRYIYSYPFTYTYSYIDSSLFVSFLHVRLLAHSFIFSHVFRSFAHSYIFLSLSLFSFSVSCLAGSSDAILGIFVTRCPTGDIRISCEQ